LNLRLPVNNRMMTPGFGPQWLTSWATWPSTMMRQQSCRYHCIWRNIMKEYTLLLPELEE
jgi:hypothetical protein